MRREEVAAWAGIPALSNDQLYLSVFAKAPNTNVANKLLFTAVIYPLMVIEILTVN